jgi:hypothetical protein
MIRNNGIGRPQFGHLGFSDITRYYAFRPRRFRGEGLELRDEFVFEEVDEHLGAGIGFGEAFDGL